MRQSQESDLSYQQLAANYLSNSFTYKSHRILKQLSETNLLFKYPYELVLLICKTFHLNQFELIFFSQILTNQQPCHEIENDIFYRPSRKLEIIKDPKDRSLYLYLVVIGYAVKYYLNDSITAYDTEIKRIVPEFTTVFQAWAKKYSNKVLKTNPKKLNTFYMELMKSQDQQDINYKNYNEIVEELGYIGPAELSEDEHLGNMVDIGYEDNFYQDSYHKTPKNQ